MERIERQPLLGKNTAWGLIFQIYLQKVCGNEEKGGEEDSG